MSRHYLKHIVTDFERWDTLAYHYYGNPLMINLLIDANPHIPFCEELPRNQIVLVPVIKAQSVDNAGMPPWMDVSDE